MGNLISASRLALAASACATAQEMCNLHPEYCNRSYVDVTEICTHNAMFNAPGSLFANQRQSVTKQLNDGVRVLQGQTHNVNGVLHFCHTSCAYLDAGPLTTFFTEVSTWLSAHQTDILTIIIANNDNAPATSYAPALTSTGLAALAYVPPKIPMALADWPTYGQMIAAGKRLVMFLDNGANQQQVPYILDQFSNLWETPFDPTDATFPCTVDRPAGLSQAQAQQRMYLSNHNLNVHLKVGSIDILMPDTARLPITNAASGAGSLGEGWRNCAALWGGRRPKVLLVDFYDVGDVIRAGREANGLV